jgi:hypothetical protein
MLIIPQPGENAKRKCLGPQEWILGINQAVLFSPLADQHGKKLRLPIQQPEIGNRQS